VLDQVVQMRRLAVRVGLGDLLCPGCVFGQELVQLGQDRVGFDIVPCRVDAGRSRSILGGVTCDLAMALPRFW
jgi:hypothetical protein